jgi:serine/threonine protein kinase
VWSLGIVAYELCCLKVPYEASSIEELIRKQKTVRLKNIPMGYSAALNELIHEMLQYYPKRRISADRVKATCLKNLKLENEDVLLPLDPLIDTIVIPESEQRWVNLVPLPPKIKKEGSTV